MASKIFKVLVSDNLAKEGIEILENHPNIKVDVKTKHTTEELKEIIGEYDGIIIRSATKMTADVISAAKNLKVIARAGTGYDNIDITACNEKGIVVLITPEGNSNAVVELTLGLMLDWSRNLARANALMQQGKWAKKQLKGRELRGKTVGIIGLGRIGAGVAKRCLAFEMKVLAYDKYVPKSRAESLGVTLVESLDDLLKEADYITFHVPLTSTTKNLIDTPQFDIMKPNAVLINVARGGVINEDALIKALNENKIGGACIDVYSKEPATPDIFPFIGMDNVITTPHLGASTYEAQIDVAKMAAEHIIQALTGNVFISAVNMPFSVPESLADVLKPYLELSRTLGKFLCKITPNPIVKVDIKYRGEIFTTIEPVRAVILFALFEKRLTDLVTYMNLDTLLSENGVEVNIEKSNKPSPLSTLIRVLVTDEKGTTHRIVGTVFSGNPKILEINEHYMDISPSNYMLLMQSHDKPGVIGKVGTFLGEHGINIAGWQLGREAQGTRALSVITLDHPLPDDVREKLVKLEDVIDATFIELE